MCKPVKCPQCGHEFTPERATKSGAWTHEEDELLLQLYQKERKLIAEIADELNRTQDATRNRLYQLRGAGKGKGKVMGYRKVSAAEQVYYIIKHKAHNLRLRFRLWRKPKKDCYHCCLWCKYFSSCRSELEADNE